PARGQPSGPGLLLDAVGALRAQPLGHGGRRRLHPGRDHQLPGGPRHPPPHRGGGHVADLPLPRARGRGGAAMMIKTEKGSAKYSRRAILKRLGIGAGCLPLLSTEQARGAAPSGFPTRFIGITWTDGICPPNFYPTGAAGPLPATLPSILTPLANWS